MRTRRGTRANSRKKGTTHRIDRIGVSSKLSAQCWDSPGQSPVGCRTAGRAQVQPLQPPNEASVTANLPVLLLLN